MLKILISILLFITNVAFGQTRVEKIDVLDGQITNKNYVKNSGFDKNAMGVVNFKHASKYQVGYGGSPTLTCTYDSVNKISNTGSLKITKPASNVQYEGCIIDLGVIGLEGEYKKMFVDMVYKQLTGTYADDDFIVYLSNIVSGKVIYLTDEKIKANALNGSYFSDFQTEESNNYVMYIKYNNTDTTAKTFLIDDLKVGVSQKSVGPVITDWIPFTPTWTNLTVGNAVQKFFYRVIGDSIVIHGAIALGTTSSVSGQIKMSLPSGFNIDQSKVMLSAYARLGHMTVFDGGITSMGLVLQDSTSTNTLYFVLKDGITIKDPISNTSFTWGTSDEIEILDVTIPILGKSSNQVVSSDSGSRSIAFTGSMSSNQAVTSGVLTKINFTSISHDTISAYNSSTHRYEIKESGDYFLKGQCTNSGAGTVAARVYVTGIEIFPAASDSDTAIASGTKKLIAGDYIELYCTLTGSSPSAIAFNWTSLTVNKIQSPQQITSGEKIALKYINSAGTSMPNSATTQVPFVTKVFDTHNAWTGTQFNCPANKLYRVTAKLGMATATWTTGILLLGLVRKNGAEQNGIMSVTPSASASLTLHLNGSGIFECTQGQNIDFAFFHNESGARSLSTDVRYNYIEIESIN